MGGEGEGAGGRSWTDHHALLLLVHTHILAHLENSQNNTARLKLFGPNRRPSWAIHIDQFTKLLSLLRCVLARRAWDPPKKFQDAFPMIHNWIFSLAVNDILGFPAFSPAISVHSKLTRLLVACKMYENDLAKCCRIVGYILLSSNLGLVVLFGCLHDLKAQSNHRSISSPPIDFWIQLNPTVQAFGGCHWIPIVHWKQLAPLLWVVLAHLGTTFFKKSLETGFNRKTYVFLLLSEVFEVAVVLQLNLQHLIVGSM